MCGGILSQATPRSNRIHIGIFGRRNAGKSSLLNSLTKQDIALTSDVPGSTTDPVYKAMEIAPIGPVVFVDTAGLDDTENPLGQKRIEKTREVFQKVDVAFLLIHSDHTQEIAMEKAWLAELEAKGMHIIIVMTHTDMHDEQEIAKRTQSLSQAFAKPILSISNTTGAGLDTVREALTKVAQGHEEPPMIAHLLPAQALVVLVMPQDKQAPKGRLILPQVQVLRELLDYGCHAVCTTTEHFARAMQRLNQKPDLIIVDSQVFGIINKQLDASQPLTSFSILMAGRKGEFAQYVAGAQKIDSLKESDSVLMLEACTHQALENDIGREQIPNALRAKVGPNLHIDVHAGFGLPPNIEKYSLIIQCASCMMSRTENMRRLKHIASLNIPITNYGLTLAKINGILERVKTPLNMAD